MMPRPAMSEPIDFEQLIWQLAELLRGPYRPSQYGRVILPLTVLRRFDCVLAPLEPAGLAVAAKPPFENRSSLDFAVLAQTPEPIDAQLRAYIAGFSPNVCAIIEGFEFEAEIAKLREAKLLRRLVATFAELDLHPARVPNAKMGRIFEGLIRRFNELANQTAGDHYTPREVVRLMVRLLLCGDDERLDAARTPLRLLDPTCGTGGLLAEAQDHLRAVHPGVRLEVYGQDYNRRAHAIAAADMLMKDGRADAVRFGDALLDDQFTTPPLDRFDYLLANPPFGVDWKPQRAAIERERDERGFDGRFGAGTPRVNDGSLLFVQHMLSKFERFEPAAGKLGARMAVVLSGGPLFAGGAGSGESEIRRWILERDLLEAIVALPEQLFYNTAIGTYIWLLSNRKASARAGKIQLIDARACWTPMARSLGDKRRKLGEGREDEPDHLGEIVDAYAKFDAGARSKILPCADFGYRQITVERPLRLRYQPSARARAQFLDGAAHLREDLEAIEAKLGTSARLDWNEAWARVRELLRARGSRWRAAERRRFRSSFGHVDPEAAPVRAAKGGGHEADPALRDTEHVPLTQTVETYFETEIRPHVPDAWIDRSKDRVAYEINFNRHFHTPAPLRSLADIDADLERVEAELLRLLPEIRR